MQTDMTILGLILQAGPVVQFIMLLLLLASIISWGLILKKRREIAAAMKEADSFEDAFWSGANLRDIYSEAQTQSQELIGMERIFEAGFREYARQSKHVNPNPEHVVDAAHRSMRVTLSREVDRLETHLNFLATVGSTSPYVGLLGTVWGIMNSFTSLSNVQQATLSMVAPGIAEALIATAMGLIAAIPAVIAYNRFSGHVDRLVNRYDNFMEEFATLIQRQVFTHD